MIGIEGKVAKPMEIPVNGEVLKWARTSAGYDIPQAKQELGITTDFLLELESPSRSYIPKALLSKLSRLYRRSELVLLLREPPMQTVIPIDYRRLPSEQTAIGPDTANALREAKRFQDILSDLSDEPGKTSTFLQILADYKQDPAFVGAEIRKLSGVDFDEQSSWVDAGYGFRAWRSKLQELGIGVYLGDFPR